MEIPKERLWILVDNVDNFVQRCLTILEMPSLSHFSWFFAFCVNEKEEEKIHKIFNKEM